MQTKKRKLNNNTSNKNSTQKVNKYVDYRKPSKFTAIKTCSDEKKRLHCKNTYWWKPSLDLEMQTKWIKYGLYAKKIPHEARIMRTFKGMREWINYNEKALLFKDLGELEQELMTNSNLSFCTYLALRIKQELRQSEKAQKRENKDKKEEKENKENQNGKKSPEPDHEERVKVIVSKIRTWRKVHFKDIDGWRKEWRDQRSQNKQK